MARRDSDVAKPIRMILSDVDGVLSDGSIILDNTGVETKVFNVRDGLGIKLWQKAGFGFGILTARNSQIVKLRAAELGISMLRQGSEDKLSAAMEMIEDAGLTPEEVCYIGDDLPDIPVLKYVGLSVTVADGVAECVAVSQWKTNARGGHGAVRELCERLLNAKGLWEDFVPQQ
jgi:YrbI family 3-deoxy-D-manno-octulosonate 8-phosphate phosphatase